MKELKMYESNDGNFRSESKEKCLAYDDLCIKVEKTMALFPKHPDNCDFSNGGGFIQHNDSTFMQVREKILRYAQDYTEHKWLQQSIDEGLKIDPSWAGRLISECCPVPLSDAWYRISCTTNDFREFGQPYYRNHPYEAKQKCLNAH